AHALGTAVSSMAGQNIGMKNWDRVRKIAVYGVLYNFSIMVAIGVFVFLFSSYGVRLFIQEPEAVTFCVTYLKIIVLCYLFIVFCITFQLCLRLASSSFCLLHMVYDFLFRRQRLLLLVLLI